MLSNDRYIAIIGLEKFLDTQFEQSARCNNLIEAQYMYWVPGNRYQVFELEPLRKLLPPHDTVLQELFGVLEEMQSSLLQGYADTTMGLGKEYKRFLAATARGVCPEEATKSSASYATEFMDKLHSSDFIHAFVMQFIGTNQVFKPLIAIHFYASNRCFSTRGPR